MSLKEYWESYKNKVVPENASQIQIEETQKSFYGGIASLLSHLINTADGTMTEDQAVQAIEEANQEVLAFMKELDPRE